MQWMHPIQSFNFYNCPLLPNRYKYDILLKSNVEEKRFQINRLHRYWYLVSLFSYCFPLWHAIT